MSEEQAEEQLVDATADEAPVEEVVEPAEEAEEAEVIVTIGEESPPPEEQEQAQAPAWVKELRKNHRELQKKNRELEEKLKSQQTPAESRVELGKKPTLEDHDYDAERFESELSKWYERKREADEQTAKVAKQKEEADKAWHDKLSAYDKAKTELKVADYEDAEHVAQEVLSQTQQGIILQGSENPALVVYALGKNPAKAKELAAITDPVKYAFAVAKLETQLKITKKSAPAPEKSISGRGSASISGSVDSTLERLRAEAARTGDHTKVLQYKTAKRKA